MTDDPRRPAEPAPWIGPMLALGTRVHRFAAIHQGRQLIVVVSVPSREFSAVLIACGWVMTNPAPPAKDPIEVLSPLPSGAAVRLVTKTDVIADTLVKVDESKKPTRVFLQHSTWMSAMVQAAATVRELDMPRRHRKPVPGRIGAFARLEETWDSRLASPTADLAIVGTKTWLKKELSAFVSTERGHVMGTEQAMMFHAAERRASESLIGYGTLADVVLPNDEGAATWATRLYSSAKLAEKLPLPADVRAVILDGAGATKYTDTIEAPVIICVIDRSVADETPAETLVQTRNTRGEPLSLADDLGWRPPAGVEGLAFTVAL